VSPSSRRTVIVWAAGLAAALAVAMLSLIRMRQRPAQVIVAPVEAPPVVLLPSIEPPINPDMRMPALLLGSALVFMLLAVLSVFNQSTTTALLWGGVATAQWALAVRVRGFSVPNLQRYVDRTLTASYTRYWRAGLLCFCVLSVIASFYSAWNGVFDWMVITGWLVGMASWWTLLNGKAPSLPILPKIALNRETAAIGVLLLIGAFALYYRLDTLPRDMISDHAEYLLDTFEVQHGVRSIYFGNNSGREPAFLYLAAFTSEVLGATSFLSLKIVSATAAFVTLPLLYLLGRQVGGRVTGLFTLGVGSVCLWSLIMGRVGFRVAFASLATAALLIFLWRALRDGHRRDFLLAGLALGLGLYGYSSFRIAPLVVLLGIGLCLLMRGNRRDLLANSFALFGMALVAFVPLLSYALHYPNIYWIRTNNLVGTLGFGDFLQALVESLLMFNFGSDEVWMNVLQPDAHVLSTLEGILFVLGLGYFVWRGIRKRDPMLLFVPLAFVVLVLPSALGAGSPLETPSARRAITALPVVVLMIGSGLALLVQQVYQRFSRRVAYALGGGVLALLTVANLSDYATYYPPGYRPAPARYVAEQMLRFAEGDGDLRDVYFVYGGGWVDPRLIGIWLGQPHWNNIVPHISPIDCLPNTGQPMMVLLDVHDNADKRWLERCFPQGWLVDFVTPENDQFTIFLVNSSHIPRPS
jgi:hypothetical protein